MISHEEIWLVGMSGGDFDRQFDLVAETRRRWSLAEKRKIAAEACVPCANVSAVARRHRVKPALLYRWKKELGGEISNPDKVTFVPVTVDAQPVPQVPTAPPLSVPTDSDDAIEIKLSNGRRVRAGTGIDTAVLMRIVNALES